MTGVIGVPFSTTCKPSFPEARKGLVLSGPHLCIYLLIEFGRHLYGKKNKKKQKKTKKNKKTKKQNKTKQNTKNGRERKAQLFPQFQGRTEQRRKALDQENDEPRFSNWQGRQNPKSFLHTQ